MKSGIMVETYNDKSIKGLQQIWQTVRMTDLITHLQHKDSMMIWSVCKLQQAGTKGIP